MTILKKILAPTDFSQNSSAAINYACDLASEHDSILHLLYVAVGNGQSESEQTERLERLASTVDARSELAIETIKNVLPGRPDRVIAQYAVDNEIDLVVMGTHGRTGLKHLAMGSVTENVLRTAPCPVMVLGPRDGDNASLSHVLAVLTDVVGEGLKIGQEEGRGVMLNRLVEKLRIPSTTAIFMLDELQFRERIRWQDDQWLIVDGSELDDDFEPIFVDEPTESQALDLLQRAFRLRATDIHIDPSGDQDHIVRFRIDGKLQNYCQMQRLVAEHLINQFKTLARLDIADPFHALEGRVKLPPGMPELEVRLTAVPVADGQAVALRLLDPQQIFLPLEDLGFSETAFDNVTKMLQQDEGLVLVTGPTGSGKTTTVYSMLETFAGDRQNIVSIEDPVEFIAPFVRQINVDVRHGLTMAAGVRTILRMDPDVVFIGEIRDPETAEIGIRAAGSGKYVFSTLHTRDIASTISALRDLGLDQRSSAANLTGIINQRLIRRLCIECKRTVDITDDQRRTFEAVGSRPPAELFEPVGCSLCNGSGFLGRIGVFEVAVVTAALRSAIVKSEPRQTIDSVLKADGFVSLQQDALAKVAAGVISFGEAVAIRSMS